MSINETYQPSRIDSVLVSDVALLRLVSRASDGFRPIDSADPLRPQREGLATIPAELSKEELSELGGRLNEIIEKMVPSKFGKNNGNQAERLAISLIARNAARHGDGVTIESSVAYLRAKGGIRNKAAAFLLSKQT